MKLFLLGKHWIILFVAGDFFFPFLTSKTNRNQKELASCMFAGGKEKKKGNPTCYTLVISSAYVKKKNFSSREREFSKIKYKTKLKWVDCTH